MFTISIDLGYRYVKGVNSNREKIMIPSFVSSAVSRDLEGLFGGTSSKRGIDVNKLHVVVDEYGQVDEYFVGDMAAWTKKPILLFGENKINHSATKAMVAAVTGILTKGNEGTLHVTAGLPLMQFTAQSDELESFLRGLNLKASFPQSDGTVAHRRVKFEKVTLFPQGAGAIYYVTVNQRDILSKKGARIGLVDVGGKTTEALMFRVNEGIDIELDRCDTFDLGTYLIEERVRSYFQSAYKRRLENNEIYNALKNGEIYFRGESIDMTDVIEKGRRALAEAIQEELNHLWGKAQDTAYLVLWAGGGASDVMHYVASDNSMLVNEAQFANAIGNLLVAELE
jgi:plasmid segregation protein ParM